MLQRMCRLLFSRQMGDCDYFTYNGRQFRVTGLVTHAFLLPLKTKEALLVLPGGMGCIDVTHVEGAKERCNQWAMKRGYTAWPAMVLTVLAILMLTGAFGFLALGFAFLVPGVVFFATAALLTSKKPQAPEEAVEQYKELLKPLYPESELPNLEPTALEAVATILAGKTVSNGLGEAMQLERVDPDKILDSSVLVHPCIAAGNHGAPQNKKKKSATLNNSRAPSIEPIKEEESDGSQYFTIEMPATTKAFKDDLEIANEDLPAGDNMQFCITSEDGEEPPPGIPAEQWKDVAVTLDKVLGPRATILGRAVLPPDRASQSGKERGGLGHFIDEAPVHDGSHIIYVETKKEGTGSRKRGSSSRSLWDSFKRL